MARTSRKARPVETLAEHAPRRYRVALYARISVEGEPGGHGDSVGNQIAMMRQYLETAADLDEAGVYADRGVSGTGFRRPEFQRMLEDIRKGAVDCIVVKDLSRFGRNYIEAGNYLEQVFPFLGVRFISLGDGLDSAQGRGDSLSLALKNMVHTFYARDISQKVSAVLAVKRESGVHMGAFAPYGYRKRKGDPGRLEPDPGSAPVVELLFRWRACRMGCGRIARLLGDLAVPAPSLYRLQTGVVTGSRFENARWHKSAVARILQNPVYLGHMVQGRQKRVLLGGGGRQKLPPSRWTVVPNTHAPLVAADVFMRAGGRLPPKMGGDVDE